MFALAREIYPRTRTSNAVALNARYYLPYRAAVHGGYRFFTDTWGIGANTFELGYTHPIRQWIFDVGYRYSWMNRQEAARVFRVAYIARAVSVGRFALPAAHAEDMYAPAIRARTSMGQLNVNP